MTAAEVKHNCPKCGAELFAVFWGALWDWDSTAEPCPKCGYHGYLDTMTGEEDGAVWQTKKDKEDE